MSVVPFVATRPKLTASSDSQQLTSIQRVAKKTARLLALHPDAVLVVEALIDDYLSDVERGQRGRR